MPGIYLALGSNLGNRQANISMALRMLAPLARVDAVSPLYESEPQPPAPGPNYLNGAARIVTGLSPLELLRHIKRIEHDIGRRDAERWAPRPIDLDIAFYNDDTIELDELAIPHPRLSERAFVLKPLLDLDPTLTHPITQEPLLALLEAVDASGLKQHAEAGWFVPLPAR